MSGRVTNVLSDRGYFWWSDAPLPVDQSARHDGVAGTLSISDTGQTKIELDGVLPNPKGRFSIMDQGAVAGGRSIAGLLKSDNRYVLATELFRNGISWRSSGFSSEVFTASYCLVSPSSISPNPRMRSITFDLSGYEEWLRLGRPRVKQTSRSFTVRHRVWPDLRFTSSAGSIRLSRYGFVTFEGADAARSTNVQECAKLRFTPPRSVDLQKAASFHGMVQDLLILLTDSEYQMVTPEVALTSRQEAKLYFGKAENDTKPPRFFDNVAPFPEIELIFGNLLFSLMELWEELGAAAYLYLATRRGLDIYEEHKFLNLMTGLEAFHRARYGDGDTTGFKRKIERILNDVSAEKDRTWLRKRLKNMAGPSLDERLFVLLDAIPVPLEKQILRKFLSECVKVRNQIAHQGRSSDADASGEPIHWLHIRNSILSYLYHAKLLLEIGLPRPIVERWLTTGPVAQSLTWYLRQAGLQVTPSAS